MELKSLRSGLALLSLGFPCSRTFADDVCQRIVRCKLLVPLIAAATSALNPLPTTTLLHLLLLLLLSCLRLTNAVTGNHYIHLVGPSPPSQPLLSAPLSTCVTSCVHKLQAASTASVYKTREGCDCCCCFCCCC